MTHWKLAHLLVAVVAVTTFIAPGAASAGEEANRYPLNAHVRGQSIVEWQRTLFRWGAGSSANPYFTDACGALVKGAFLIAPPTNSSGQRTCKVPKGVPLVVSPAGAFGEIPTFGSTDAEIIADTIATWDLLDYSSASLDGRTIRVSDAARLAGAYNLRVHEDSFYDLINEGTPDDWAPGDTVRMSSKAQVVVLPPLRPGTHALRLIASFGDAGYFDESYVLKVGRRGACNPHHR